MLRKIPRSKMRIEISPRYIPLSPYIYEVLNKGKDRFANDI
tara:strand:- start:550 stop:672 length:123 start_codon:yes stop_codon:yes gene_type:complete